MDPRPWAPLSGVLPDGGPLSTTLPRHTHAVYPPEDWEARMCADDLDGDEDTCRLTVDPRRVEDVWLHAFLLDAAASFTIEGGTDAEWGLILSALALLQDASDLVRWAMCWFNGDPEGGRCMRAYLAGEGEERVKIIVEEGTDPDEPSAMLSIDADTTSLWEWLGLSRGTRTIRVWRDHPTVAALVAMSERDDSPVEHYCAAFLLAPLLLHELAHLCGREEEDTPGTCSDPYVIQNLFVHAAFHLHREVIEADCCRDAWENDAALSTGETMRRPIYFATAYSMRAC